MESLGQIIEAKNEEIVDHKSTIATLEMKNRKLNDLVNKTIYGKTQDNIDKTINIFKRNPKLASDPRMQEIMYQKPLTVENAVQDLMDQQKRQEMMMADSRQPNVLNDHTRLTGAIVQ